MGMTNYKTEEEERTFTKINFAERLSTITNKRKKEEKERLKKFNEREKLLAERMSKRKSDLLEYVSDKKNEWDQKLNIVKNNQRRFSRGEVKKQKSR